jgi:hypothetical protein
MLTADELLALLDEAIEEAKDPRGKKLVLKDIFQPLGYGDESELDQAKGLDRQTAIEIIRKLIQLTAGETKASYAARISLREARLFALHEILGWLGRAATQSPFFSGAGSCHVAVQMALRVRKPSSMNQGMQGFCGPASVLVPLLKLRPFAYVQFVCSLFDNGTAPFCGHTVDVRLATAFLQGWTTVKGPAADYIALGSLRCNIEALVAAPGGTAGMPFDFTNDTSHATTPSQIAGLLTQAGYQNVQNCAMGDYLAPRHGTGLGAAGRNLQQCVQLLLNKPGAVVVMLVHGALARSAKRNTAMEPLVQASKLADLHWIFVRRITATGLPVNGGQLNGQVTMKLFTWRWSGPGQFTLGDFLPRYFGFISAEPA